MLYPAGIRLERLLRVRFTYINKYRNKVLRNRVESVIRRKCTWIEFQHMSPISILPRNRRCPASFLPRITVIPLQDNRYQTLYPKHPR